MLRSAAVDKRWHTSITVKGGQAHTCSAEYSTSASSHLPPRAAAARRFRATLSNDLGALARVRGSSVSERARPGPHEREPLLTLRAATGAPLRSPFQTPSHLNHPHCVCGLAWCLRRCPGGNGAPSRRDSGTIFPADSATGVGRGSLRS